MRRLRFVAIAMLAFFCVVAAAPKKSTHKTTARKVHYDPSLPSLSEQLGELPDGDGKALAEGSCIACHSPDMLMQQRLTEKQWTAEVEKMTKWGAEVSADDRLALIAYLSQHFGPTNKYTPRATKPVGY